MNKNCCGCTACYAICPQKAITMVDDKKGFSYPLKDKEKCTNCGLCESVCPLENVKNDFLVYGVYALKNKDLEKRKKTQSAGTFIELATYVLKQNGIVFGCKLVNNREAVHSWISSLDDLYAFSKSKYIESKIKNSYLDVKKFLLEDKLVLFSGTPCQVQGLVSFLEISHVSSDKLITCDIICHGVPSPKVWTDYLDIMEEENGPILEARFRDKKYGWSDVYGTLLFKNHKSKEKDLTFMYLFLYNLIIRENCYSCKYTTPYRNSDITIGDFWGIEKIDPSFKDENGVSLLITRTDKAAKIFASIRDNFDVIESKIEDINQPNISKPSSKNAETSYFWKEYFKKGPKKTIYKYSNNSFFRKITRKTRKLISIIFKKNSK